MGNNIDWGKKDVNIIYLNERNFFAYIKPLNMCKYQIKLVFDDIIL